MSFAIVFHFANSQFTFQSVYGGAASEKWGGLSLTKDNGFLLCGRASSWGPVATQSLVIKTDSTGNVEWIRILGATGVFYAKATVELADGSIMVGGHDPNTTYNKLLYKLDSAGNLIWYKSHGTGSLELIRELKLSPGGEIIASGYSHGTWNAAADCFLTKVDTAGNVIWNKNYGNTDNDWLHGSNFTPTNEIVFCGYRSAYSSDPGWEATVYKTDSVGNLIWSFRYGGSGDQLFDAITIDSDSGYILSGSTTVLGNGGEDFLFVKLDKNGNVIWSKAIGGLQNERAMGIVVTQDGNYVSVGTSTSFGQGSSDFLMVKLDTNGNLIWAKTFGGVGLETPQGSGDEIFQLANGQIVFGGETTSFGSGSNDLMLVRTDSSGETPGCNYGVVNPSVVTLTLAKTAISINVLSSSGISTSAMVPGIGTDVVEYLCCGVASSNFSASDNCTNDTLTFTSLAPPNSAIAKYYWDFDGNGTIDDSSGGNVKAVLLPGTYNSTLITIDTCGFADTIQLQVLPSNSPLNVNLGPDTSMCSASGYLLNAGNSGNTFLWNNNATTQTILATSSGSYSVIVTDPNGCTGMDTVLMTILNTPVFSLSAPPMCEGDSSLCVSASVPGLNYLWSNGATGDSICPNFPGTFSATATDSLTGCKYSDTIFVPMYPGPFVNLGPDTMVCPNDTICLSTGGGGSVFTWSNGDTTATSCLDTGKHYVVVADSFGCYRSDTIVIGEWTLPTAAFGIDSSECPVFTFQNNSSVSGTANYSWSFGNGMTDTSANPQYDYTSSGNGQFLVQLIVTTACGADTLSFLLVINCISGFDPSPGDQFSVFPNPASSTLILRTSLLISGELEINFLNPLGIKIPINVESVTSGKWKLDVSSLPAGLYFLSVSTPEMSLIRKIEVIKE